MRTTRILDIPETSTARLCGLIVAGLAVVLLVGAASGAASADDAVDEFRATMERWVASRQVLSKERADWLVEKETLEATRGLLEREREALRAEIKGLEERDAGASEERLDLLRQRDDYQASAASLEAKIRVLESRVLALVPRLPGPLQDRVELLLVQIPDDPEQTRVPLGQRLMNVLGVLAQAEKFNSTATFVGETRSIGSDPEAASQKVQVRTLYWGLAQAIYVDSQGRAAGIGRPTPDGWAFREEPDLADRARLLLDIYEGNVDTIAFVPLPVEIQ